MSSNLGFVLAAALALALPRHASATLFDDFESYADQAAFQAAWPSWLPNGTSMDLVQGFGHSGVQSISGVASAGDRRNYRNLDSFAAYRETDANPLEFELWLYDQDATLPAAPDLAQNYCEVRAYEEDGMPPTWFTRGYHLQGLLDMGIYESAGTQYGGGAGGRGHYAYHLYYGGLNAWYATAARRTVGWHNMRMILSGASARIYVDGALDAEVPWANPNALYPMDGVILGSGLTSAGYDVAFDDVRLDVVPDPMTVVLLAAGGSFRRRRRS